MKYLIHASQAKKLKLGRAQVTCIRSHLIAPEEIAPDSNPSQMRFNSLSTSWWTTALVAKLVPFGASQGPHTVGIIISIFQMRKPRWGKKDDLPEATR